MTTPQGPRRRRRPSESQLRARRRVLGQVIAPELAAELAPSMPLNSRRTRRILSAMRRRVRDNQRTLMRESTYNAELDQYEHDIYGVIDGSIQRPGSEAVYFTTEEVTRAFYTGDDADYEPELHALVSP